MRIPVALSTLPLLLCGLSPAHAVTVGGVKITSAYCQSAYAGLKRQPLHYAFAISPDGQVCNTAYGYGSKAEAQASAKAGCEDGKRRCKVVASK